MTTVFYQTNHLTIKCTFMDKLTLPQIYTVYLSPEAVTNPVWGYVMHFCFIYSKTFSHVGFIYWHFYNNKQIYLIYDIHFSHFRNLKAICKAVNMLQFIIIFMLSFSLSWYWDNVLSYRKKKTLRKLSETQTSGSFYEIGLASSPLCAVAHL